MSAMKSLNTLFVFSPAEVDDSSEESDASDESTDESTVSQQEEKED